MSHQQKNDQEESNSKFWSQKDQKIILRAKSVSHILSMSEATHLICDCYLTTVYTSTGGAIVVAKLLKEFEEELKDYGFVRVNRNTIVNIMHVASYASGRKRMVALSSKASVQVSRRGLARLKEVVELK